MRVVRSSVEEINPQQLYYTLNGLLDAKANRISRAQRKTAQVTQFLGDHPKVHLHLPQPTPRR
jgi:O-acetylhomoserine/O-acetylserine sulfhydrylase-like pyridoxal-dependent enzyme